MGGRFCYTEGMAEPSPQSGHGNVLMQWTFPEFEQPQRSLTWYVVAIVVVITLILVSLWTRNFLFLIIVLLSAALIIQRGRRPAAHLSVAITDTGILLGNRRFYEYGEMRTFWMVYDPPEVKRLFITLRGLHPDIIIPLERQNPLKIRQMLSKYVPEDVERESEPPFETIGRSLKL